MRFSKMQGVTLTEQSQAEVGQVMSAAEMWARTQRELANDLKQGRALQVKDANDKKQGLPKEPDQFTIYNCKSLSDWLAPETDKYQGLRMQRGFDPKHFQPAVDSLPRLGGDIGDDIQNKRVESLNPCMPKAELAARLQLVGGRLSHGLPADLAKMVSQDTQAMAWTLAELLPEAKELIIKLEKFTTFVCSRWHTDDYVARALVAYNCSGTEYTEDANVNFWEMEHCGNNDHIIRDKSDIRSINVGDILLIKGQRFPGSAKSLVHKSPDPQFRADGSCITRLILKVDIA